MSATRLSREFAIIKSILRRFLTAEGTEVFIFGSRARGSAYPASDLDLLIRGPEEIPLDTLGFLKEAFEESLLPFKVDVADYHRVSDRFRKNVLASAKRLPLRKDVGKNAIAKRMRPLRDALARYRPAALRRFT